MKSFTLLKTKNGFLLDLSQKKLETDTLERLSALLTDEKCPKNLTVDFYQAGLKDRDADQLAKILETKKCQEGLALILDNNPDISTGGLKKIVDVLPHCPERFKLSLFNAKFFRSRSYHPPKPWDSSPTNYNLDSVLRAFIEPIKNNQSKDWPQGFQLCVDQFIPLIETIADGIKSGSFPPHFKLDFKDFNPSIKSIEADEKLIEALQSPHCAPGFGLNHRFPPYTKSFAFFRKKSISPIDLIANGNYPKDLELDFTQHNGWIPRNTTLFPTQPESIAYEQLAEALLKNQGPAWSLTIDFVLAEKEVPGWKKVLDALKHNHTLTTLKINFLEPHMIDALIETLKENSTITSVSYGFDSSKFPKAKQEEIHELLEKNRIGKGSSFKSMP